jgi:uncharacterized membrane protein YebE (DUF533 family)
MKTAPITVTEIALLGGVVVLGVLAYKAYSALPNLSLSGAVAGASDYVDVRSTSPNSTLGVSQSWVDQTVRKGQDAGASTFVTSFFTGLFK